MKGRGTPPHTGEGESAIDRLYQGPLEEFTAARNALAKRSGKDAAAIRALPKPPVAAWAVNQLYWRRRPLYDALIEAAQQVRRVHAAVLGGRAGDVRGAGKAHEERVNAALDAALDIAGTGGQPATDATRQAIATTLRALPADEPPGRLTRTLQPGGFEMLAGLSIGGEKAGRAVPITAGPAPPPAHKPDVRKPGARDTKALTRMREAVAAATRAMKHAEHTAQREEFERARTVKDVEKAAMAVAAAHEAVEEAEQALREAEAGETAARQKKDAAERRAQQADQAVDAARTRLDTAQSAIDAVG
jgi:hypothetical protein